MGRIIGLIGCTCLVIAVLRLSNMGHTNATLKGGVDRSPAARNQSAREHYRRGKELYLRGRYDDAALALESAVSAPAGLSPMEKQQADDYLRRTQAKLNGLPTRAIPRGQSPDDEATFAKPVRGKPAGDHGDAVRTRVERLMSQAQQALKQGNRAEARKLAQQAVQLAKSGNLKFDSRETTPAQMLARIDAAGKPAAASGDIRQAGGAATEADTVELVAGTVETDAEAEFSPWAESESEVDAATEAGTEISGDLSQEELARQLVASAREDLDAGRYAEARRKALQADELDVPWSLLEDQPILILEAVDKRSDSTTLAHTNSTPRRPADAPKVDADARKSALDLLKAARHDLEQGQPETAREKALAAQELKVVYKTFDDRPELLLQDIDAQISASNSTDNVAEWGEDAETESAVAPDAQQRKQQAKALLAQARKALEAGDADAARELAVQADELNVPLGVFDDTPDQVLADIARTVEKSSGETGAAAPRSEGANLASKKLAMTLLKQSRALLAEGRLEDAMLKAKKAENLGVTFDVVEDRPEAVLADIEAAMDAQPVASRTRTSDPEVQAVASGTGSGFEQPAAVEHADGEEVLAPIGSSAVECYNRGMAELKKGDRAAAYDAFVAAHQTGQKLDRVRAQRLQDFLRELAPRGRNVRPANHQIADADPDAEFPTAAGGAEPNIIDSVDQQLRVKHDRMRSDVLNAVFKAERLRDKDPEKGVAVIDEAIVQVEESDLTGEGRASLLRTLERTRTGLETTITQQQPNLEQKRKNEEVLAAIETRGKNQIRIEQELAKLVEEFNELMEQRRYPEAEAAAKKAKELNPHEPTVIMMTEKAKMARRIASNDKLREEKDESLWKILDGVEQGLIVPVDDEHPFRHGSDWADITKRRDGKYGVDNRNRSDVEIQIEKSLGKRISLHEDQVPLSEVLNKIGILAGFSMYIDDQGLADENVVATETPVTINVEAITVKSALNLLLERYNLGYTIQDEVLKITSRMRQQGEMVARTYNVADLVVPIPSVVSAAAPSLPGLPTGVTNGTGGAQFSVPAGQAMGQIGPQADFGPLGMGGNSRGASTQARQELDFDSLNELIVRTIAPESWDAVGGQATIRHYEQTLSLVIRQTQKIHEEIADLLGQLRRLQDLQVTVEVRFVTVSDRFFERVGLDFDFNVPDSLGPAEFDNIGNPIPRFGNVMLPAAGQSQNQAGQNNQGGQNNQQGQNQQGQQQQGNSNFLTPDPERSLTPGNFRTPTVVGLSSPGQFQQNYDIPFQQGSFEVGVPTFGGFNPNAGVQVGFAILSDIEAFFFIQAAQADQRNNLLFAPKVTLFNGQSGTVVDQVQRPFVISLIPTVGFFSTGFQPVISVVPDGVQLSVTAVISADRRYVRLTVLPFFTNITDVFTFSFLGGTGGQQGQVGGQLGQQGQQGQGGFGGQQGGFGGQQFGIGGSMGTSQLLQSAITQVGGQFGQNQGGQQNQQGQQNQGGAAVTVTVQQPVVEVITVSTTVSVPDGGTVLLGGVKRLREGRAMAGVPILNKIPYINRLFKNTGVGRETESLMLMVTPRIIIQEEEEELLGIPTN